MQSEYRIVFMVAEFVFYIVPTLIPINVELKVIKYIIKMGSSKSLKSGLVLFRLLFWYVGVFLYIRCVLKCNEKEGQLLRHCGKN